MDVAKGVSDTVEVESLLHTIIFSAYTSSRMRNFFPGQLTSIPVLSILLIVVTLVLYGPTVRFGYISIDDEALVTKNPLIRDFSPTTLLKVFTSYDPELYVPLTTLSYSADYALAGLSPSVSHGQNVLLHLLCTLLVFRIFLQLGLRKFAALFGALLFAVHPINTEAVAWIAARKDLLSTFFGFLSISMFLSYVRRTEKHWLALSLAAFALGLFAKVTILLLPAFFVLLLPREQSRLSRFRTISPFVVLTIIFGGIAILGKMRTFGAAIPLFTYPLLAAKATVLSLFHFVVPLRLSPLYPQLTPIHFFSPEFALPLFSVAVLLVIVCVAARRSRSVAIGVTLFLVAFLPSFLTFTKNGEVYVTSDRYVYFASVGVFWLVANLFSSMWDALKARSKLGSDITVAGALTLLILLFAGSSFQRSYWLSDSTLMRRVIVLAPGHALAYNNLGANLRREGDRTGAAAQFRAAIAANPHFVLPRINLASLLVEQGDTAGAEAEYRAAIAAIDTTKRLRAEDLAGYYLLADVLREKGDNAGALILFTEAAMRGSDIAEAQFNLAVTLHSMGKLSEAEAAYHTALSLDSSLTTGHYNLAEILAGSGRLPEAIAALDAVLKLDPAYPQAAEHRARIGAMVGGRSEK